MAKNTKPTNIERERYAAYLKLAQDNHFQPRSEEEWLVYYRTQQKANKGQVKKAG